METQSKFGRRYDAQLKQNTFAVSICIMTLAYVKKEFLST